MEIRFKEIHKIHRNIADEIDAIWIFLQLDHSEDILAENDTDNQPPVKTNTFLMGLWSDAYGRHTRPLMAPGVGISRARSARF